MVYRAIVGCNPGKRAGCRNHLCLQGPTPMLRALKAYAAENKIECWISMEEKMACGIGACIPCVCKSKEVDAHTNVHNKRVCKEQFAAEEVEL
ncbi:MAG: hypothetical protein V8R80_11435 [Eubacterium sp.]